MALGGVELAKTVEMVELSLMMMMLPSVEIALTPLTVVHKVG